MGDIRGKGLEAVQLAAAAIRAFQEAALTTERLEDLPGRLEDALLPGLGPEDFLTCVMVELGKNRILRVVNCGHPSPLVLSEEDGAVAIEPPVTVPPIGLGSRGVVRRVQLAADERLLLYTDGLVEARDRNGGFVCPKVVLDGVHDHDVSEVADVVVDRLRERTGGRIRDDLALVVVEAFCPHEPPAVLPSSPPADVSV